MKQVFIVSLCERGILGGSIIADEEAVTYRTGKVSVPAGLRNLRMDYAEIRGVSKGWLMCFPTVTLRMRGGENRRFIVFARKRFCDLLTQRTGLVPEEDR